MIDRMCDMHLNSQFLKCQFVTQLLREFDDAAPVVLVPL